MNMDEEAARVLYLVETFGVPTLITAAAYKLKTHGKHEESAKLIALAGEIAKAYGTPVTCPMTKGGLRCEKAAGHEGDVHRIRDTTGTVGLFSSDEADHGSTLTGV